MAGGGPSGEKRAAARLLRAVARREDWPAATNSLLVEASAPMDAVSVRLRYTWGDASAYELPLDKVRKEEAALIWSCLLLVPKEKTEVLFSFAIGAEEGEIVLDDGGQPFKAVF